MTQLRECNRGRHVATLGNTRESVGLLQAPTCVGWSIVAVEFFLQILLLNFSSFIRVLLQCSFEVGTNLPECLVSRTLDRRSETKNRRTSLSLSRFPVASKTAFEGIIQAGEIHPVTQIFPKRMKPILDGFIDREPDPTVLKTDGFQRSSALALTTSISRI